MDTIYPYASQNEIDIHMPHQIAIGNEADINMPHKIEIGFINTPNEKGFTTQKNVYYELTWDLISTLVIICALYL